MMKMAFRPIEINGNLYFAQRWDAQNFSKLYTLLKISIIKQQILLIKMLDKVTFFMIFRMHYHWSIDYCNVLQLTIVQWS